MSKTFLSVNFGCRVNSAESNQWSQSLIDQGFLPTISNPDVILINTCSVTKKGEKESLNKVKNLHQKYPEAQIYVTGCANLEKIKGFTNVFIAPKEKLLEKLNSSYTPEVKDKFSHTNRFLLKIQSGCTQFCSYCIVPLKRPQLWSLEIDQAINIVNKAISDGYKEIIVTGVNIDEYQYKLSSLIEGLLKETKIELISFGSIPINCIDQKFIELFKSYPQRLSNFLHIPIQSGSDKILKLMNRPYNSQKIKNITEKLKSEIRNLKLGTDVIVGFPTEEEGDFQETLKLCQNIGFSKIHVFRYSSRPNTLAKIIHDTNSKISKETLKSRSLQIRNLI
jgi:threonylcarbamoyladenosine tRNA methylthiotransferase MtaB